MSSWDSQSRSPKLSEIRITRDAWHKINERITQLESAIREQAVMIENIEKYLEKISD